MCIVCMTNISISPPNGWNVIDRVLEKLPRSVSRSKAFCMAVEHYDKILTQQNNMTLQDFESIKSWNLDADSKVWKELMKGMTPAELKELKKVIQKKMNLVEEQLYRGL